MSKKHHPTKHPPTSPKLTVIEAKEEKPTQTFKAEYHQGIIPHPDLMKGYGEIDPDFPSQIMGWTDEQLLHDRAVQNRALWFTFIERLLNNIFGIIAISVLVGTGIWFMLEGHAKEGAAIICSTVVATAGIFVLRKRTPPDAKRQKNNLPEKR